MDAFKLLSRSTKLPKHSKKTPTTTPSCGQDSNPQLFGQSALKRKNPSAEDSTLDGNSKKRKRGSKSGEVSSTILPSELDIFHEGYNNRTEEQESKQEGECNADVRGNDRLVESASGHILKEEEEEEEDRLLSEDECRRVLRTHKLKLTVLEDHHSAEEEAADSVTSKSKKKRKRVTESSAEQCVKKKSKLQLYPQPLTDFRQLRTRYGISRRLAENLADQGYEIPTEVQLGSLPVLLGSPRSEQSSNETVDLLTVAPTGSGKTLAFLIPALHAILRRRTKPSTASENSNEVGQQNTRGPQAIILAPTKELASQIVNEGRKLALRTGVKVTLMRKGMILFQDDDDTNDSDHSEASIDAHEPKVRDNKRPSVKAEIVVSTPMTLLNGLQKNGAVQPLSTVQELILDEADVLLDQLFRDQTLEIWRACINPQLRISLWSATMGSNIEECTKSTLSRRWEDLPTASRKGHTRNRLVRLVVGLKDSAIPNISHHLTYAAVEQGKLMALRQFLHPTGPSPNSSSSSSNRPSSTSTPQTLRPPFLVFTQTIPRAIALCAELRYDIPPEAGGSSRLDVLHADLSDRAREHVMTRFRRGDLWVLITTDLLARGVDFRGVNAVVNYDMPTSAAAYVHRVGRTGRAGREGGVAVTLYTKEDLPFMRNVLNVISACERMKSGGGDGGGGDEGGIKKNAVHEVQKLLDALPTPSKREKQQLKKRGVEVRRPNAAAAAGGAAGKEAFKARISTKSGYDRRRKMTKVRHDDQRGAMTRTTRQGLADDGVSSSTTPAAAAAAVLDFSDEFEGFSD